MKNCSNCRHINKRINSASDADGCADVAVVPHTFAMWWFHFQF